MRTTSESHPVAAHELLGNYRRQLVIRYLSLFSQGATISARHIARVIRGIETNTPPGQVGTAEYESAYNSLIQSHLPKLDDAEVLAYDDRSKEVVVTPQLRRYAFVMSVTEMVTRGQL